MNKASYNKITINGKNIIINSNQTIVINNLGTAEIVDNNKVILSVDGKSTNKLSEGDSYKISGDNYITIKDILYTSKSTSTSKVDVSVGSGKLVLEDGKEVDTIKRHIDYFMSQGLDKFCETKW